MSFHVSICNQEEVFVSESWFLLRGTRRAPEQGLQVVSGKSRNKRSKNMRNFGSPKYYDSFEAFEREEIRPLNRIGFTVDDLEAEANFREREVSYDEVEELDFG